MNKKTKSIREVIYNILNTQVRKHCLLHVKNKHIINNDFIYPHQNETLLEKLTGEENVCKTSDYFYKKNREPLRAQAKFKNYIDNGHFNPYKEYELADAYVTGDTLVELDLILAAFEEPDIQRTLIHVGEKGSGKTIAQNVWLSQNNKKLEDKSVFWVRCDAHRLYRQWVQYLAQFDSRDNKNAIPFEKLERIATIDDYLKVQLTYVFCKYCFSNDNTFLITLADKIKEAQIIYEMPNSRHHEHHREPTSLIDTIGDLSNTIGREEKGKSESYSYAIDHVLRLSASTMQLEKRKWIAVADALGIFFRDVGVRLLRVLDGVDNVHINNDSSRHYYNHMVREIFEFTKRKPNGTDVHFVAMRRRTFIDLMRYPITHQTGGYVEHQEISQCAPDFIEILDKRVDLVSTKLAIGEGQYADILRETIEGLPTEINHHHHNNVREFLHNKSNLALLVYYRMLQISAKGFNIQSHIAILEQRNLFLNGRLFLRSQRDWEEMNSEMGVCMFNIFFYRDSLHPCTMIQNWYGLCGVRILQLLESQKPIKEDELKTYLSTVLKYPGDLVVWNIQRFRAFGMVDTEDPYSEGPLHLRISEKGKYFLAKTFNNMDFLYFFALDSMLPIGFIDAGLIDAHDNSFYGASRYPSAAIKTIVTFTLFLSAVNKIEGDHLKNNKANSNFPGFNTMTLPIQDRQHRQYILSDIGALISACDEDDIAALELYVEKMQTIT